MIKYSFFLHSVLRCLLFLTFFNLQGQIDPNIYKFDSGEGLSDDVKKIIRDNVKDKSVVFIGESVHYSGSDFLAKTKVVEYLVKELQFTDIAFESDFFGLFFDHSKLNIFPHWSKSVQCQKLFDIVEKENVNLWGFDNQLHSKYSANHFDAKLKEFLKSHGILVEDRFLELTGKVAKNYYNTKEVLTKTDVEYVHKNLEILLNNDKVKDDLLWYQILDSFRSALLIYTTHYSLSKAVPIRDAQMAKNLNFITKRLENRKVIVWLANAHMSNCNEKFMKGKTMGFQYARMNPNSSYSIAVGSLILPPRTEKDIIKAHRDRGSLVHFLPALNENFFIDVIEIRKKRPEIANAVYNDNDIFNLNNSKAKWFQHFDAIIFVTNGEEIKRTD